MKVKQLFIYSIIVLLCGCASSKEEKWHPTYRVQGGLNYGGIVENTDFKNTNISPDAFSGATKSGFNAGGRVLLPVLGQAVESGLDFMLNNQTFTFKDAAYTGTRDISTSQFMIPILFDFGFFKEDQPLGALQLKFGYVMQFNITSVTDKGNVPDYSTKGFSSGFSFGLSATPFKLLSGNAIGFFFEGYRGTKIYDDPYNDSSFKMPGSSFMKFGVIYQFSL